MAKKWWGAPGIVCLLVVTCTPPSQTVKPQSGNLGEVDSLRNEVSTLRMAMVDMEDEFDSLRARKDTVVVMESRQAPVDLPLARNARQPEDPAGEPAKMEQQTPKLADSSSLRQAPVVQQHSPDMLLSKANELFSAHRYDEAMNRYIAITKQFPPTVFAVEEAFYWIPECYYRKNDYDGAIRRFYEYLEKYPQGRYMCRIWALMATIYKEQNNAKDRQDAIGRLRTSCADSLAAWKKKGVD